MLEMNWPEHWELVSLSDQRLFSFENGIWKGKKGPFKECAVVRNTNFTKDGHLDLTNVAVLPIEQRHLTKKSLKWGDIIIERSGGGPEQPVGRVVFFDLNEGTYCFSNFTSRLRVIDKNTIYPIFLFFYLLYFYDSGQTRKLQKRTTGIRNLIFGDYKESKIPLPPLPEQSAIAHVLQTIQAAKAARQRELALERERKAALMDYLFSHGTKGEPRKETEIGEIPESWELRTIVEICERMIDYRGRTPKFSESGIVHLRSSNVKEGRLILKDDEITYVTEETYKSFMTRGFPKAGDIIFTTEGPLGESAMVPPNFRFSLAQRMILLRADKTILDSAYLLYALYSEKVRKEYLRRATGSTAKGISSKNFQQVQVPLPCLPEQRKIAGLLTACDTKIAALEQEAARLDELFHAMLDELMTGKRSAVSLIDAELPN